MSDAGQKENIEIKDIFFQNGLKYTSSVFSNGNLVKLSRYFTSGKISQVLAYNNGLLESKKIYNRNGELVETISYDYYDTGEIASIIKECTNNIVSVTFIREEDGRISNIRIRHNNIITRRIDYEYTKNGVFCTDINQNASVEYTLLKPPEAGEEWLISQRPNSIVMRKLLAAMSVSA